MSCTIETIINCDSCGEPFCDGDTRHKTAKHQRSDFEECGWLYKYGKDFCPICKDSPTFKPKNFLPKR